MEAIKTALNQNGDATEFVEIDTDSTLVIDIDSEGAMSVSLEAGAYFIDATAGCYLQIAENPDMNIYRARAFVGPFSNFGVFVPEGHKIFVISSGADTGKLHITPARRV